MTEEVVVLIANPALGEKLGISRRLPDVRSRKNICLDTDSRPIYYTEGDSGKGLLWQWR